MPVFTPSLIGTFTAKRHGGLINKHMVVGIDICVYLANIAH